MGADHVSGRIVVSADALERFCAEIFARLGVPKPDATLAARSIVEADLRGVESHGVIRMMIYAERLRAGAFNPRPGIHIVRETRSTAVVDGDNGLGQIVGAHAMSLAIDKGRAGDPAFVAVRNSNHYGAAAWYAEMACTAEMIGVGAVVGSVSVQMVQAGMVFVKVNLYLQPMVLGCVIFLAVLFDSLRERRLLRLKRRHIMVESGQGQAQKA